MDWGKAFSQIRKKSGRKQGEVAASIGIAQDTLSRIERGIKNPSEETVSKFAQAFGLDVNYVALVATLVDMSPAAKEKLQGLMQPGLEELILDFVK